MGKCRRFFRWLGRKIFRKKRKPSKVIKNKVTPSSQDSTDLPSNANKQFSEEHTPSKDAKKTSEHQMSPQYMSQDDAVASVLPSCDDKNTTKVKHRFECGESSIKIIEQKERNCIKEETVDSHFGMQGGQLGEGHPKYEEEAPSGCAKVECGGSIMPTDAPLPENCNKEEDTKLSYCDVAITTEGSSFSSFDEKECSIINSSKDTEVESGGPTELLSRDSDGKESGAMSPSKSFNAIRERHSSIEIIGSTKTHAYTEECTDFNPTKGSNALCDIVEIEASTEESDFSPSKDSVASNGHTNMKISGSTLATEESALLNATGEHALVHISDSSTILSASTEESPDFNQSKKSNVHAHVEIDGSTLTHVSTEESALSKDSDASSGHAHIEIGDSTITSVSTADFGYFEDSDAFNGYTPVATIITHASTEENASLSGHVEIKVASASNQKSAVLSYSEGSNASSGHTGIEISGSTMTGTSSEESPHFKDSEAAIEHGHVEIDDFDITEESAKSHLSDAASESAHKELNDDSMIASITASSSSNLYSERKNTYVEIDGSTVFTKEGAEFIPSRDIDAAAHRENDDSTIASTTANFSSNRCREQKIHHVEIDGSAVFTKENVKFSPSKDSDTASGHVHYESDGLTISSITGSASSNLCGGQNSVNVKDCDGLAHMESNDMPTEASIHNGNENTHKAAENCDVNTVMSDSDGADEADEDSSCIESDDSLSQCQGYKPFDYARYEGNPTNRKRFFAFAWDRTLPPEFGMRNQYEDIRRHRVNYANARYHWHVNKQAWTWNLPFAREKDLYNKDFEDSSDDEGATEPWYTTDEEEEIMKSDPLTFPEYHRKQNEEQKDTTKSGEGSSTSDPLPKIGEQQVKRFQEKDLENNNQEKNLVKTRQLRVKERTLPPLRKAPNFTPPKMLSELKNSSIQLEERHRISPMKEEQLTYYSLPTETPFHSLQRQCGHNLALRLHRGQLARARRRTTKWLSTDHSLQPRIDKNLRRLEIAPLSTSRQQSFVHVSGVLGQSRLQLMSSPKQSRVPPCSPAVEVCEPSGLAGVESGGSTSVPTGAPSSGGGTRGDNFHSSDCSLCRTVPYVKTSKSATEEDSDTSPEPKSEEEYEDDFESESKDSVTSSPDSSTESSVNSVKWLSGPLAHTRLVSSCSDNSNTTDTVNELRNSQKHSSSFCGSCGKPTPLTQPSCSLCEGSKRSSRKEQNLNAVNEVRVDTLLARSVSNTKVSADVIKKPFVQHGDLMELRQKASISVSNPQKKSGTVVQHKHNKKQLMKRRGKHDEKECRIQTHNQTIKKPKRFSKIVKGEEENRLNLPQINVGPITCQLPELASERSKISEVVNRVYRKPKKKDRSRSKGEV